MTHVIDHMGHTWDVHRDFYRQYSSIIERLDVAKLLMIQDTNRVSEFRRKGISEIDVQALHAAYFQGKT